MEPTGSILDFRCSRCKADPGDVCLTPSGNESLEPHQARVTAYWAAQRRKAEAATSQQSQQPAALAPPDSAADTVVTGLAWPAGPIADAVREVMPKLVTHNSRDVLAWAVQNPKAAKILVDTGIGDLSEGDMLLTAGVIALPSSAGTRRTAYDDWSQRW